MDSWSGTGEVVFSPEKQSSLDLTLDKVLRLGSPFCFSPVLIFMGYCYIGTVKNVILSLCLWRFTDAVQSKRRDTIHGFKSPFIITQTSPSVPQHLTRPQKVKKLQRIIVVF
jgi:hypothetical protein